MIDTTGYGRLRAQQENRRKLWGMIAVAIILGLVNYLKWQAERDAPPQPRALPIAIGPGM